MADCTCRVQHIACAFILLLAAAAGGREIAVTVENTSGTERPAGPVTFGMIFARGDVKGPGVRAGLDTQCDVKRLWPDGSIKHAIVTVNLPPLDKGGNLKLDFTSAPATVADPPPAAAQDLEKIADVEVLFDIHGGPKESVSLKRLVAAGQPHRAAWLSGPLVREWHFKAAPTDARQA